MKITGSDKPHEQGMAVVIMLALLSIMLLWIGANTMALNRLDRELKWLEQRQIRRLASSTSAGTNTPAQIQTATPARP